MCDKVLHALSVGWSNLWSPLLAAGLVWGFQYLLKRRDERRALRGKLSEEVYIPMRKQLSEAEQAIRESKRASSINTQMWRDVCSTGRARELNSAIKQQLGVLYDDTLPSYDQVWQDLNVEIGRVGSEWDQRYPDLGPGDFTIEDPRVVSIVWWDFLTQDTPVLPVRDLGQSQVLRIWNKYMTPIRFTELGLTVEQFLTQRWEEMSQNNCVRSYRDHRQRALTQIPKAIARLDSEVLY